MDDRTCPAGLSLPADRSRSGRDALALLPGAASAKGRRYGVIGRDRRSDRSGVAHLDCRLRRDGGDPVEVVLYGSLIDDAGGVANLVFYVEDVTDRRAAERDLIHRATHDSLTNLPNRALLLDRLAQALARRDRDVSALALLFIDVDGFKAINDTFGHACGDAVLECLARALEKAIRPGDTVARLGGDEFVVVCERTGAAGAGVIAQRLCRAALVGDDEGAPGASISVGIAVARGPDAALGEELIGRADAAMYERRRDGSSRTSRVAAPPRHANERHP